MQPEWVQLAWNTVNEWKITSFFLNSLLSQPTPDYLLSTSEVTKTMLKSTDLVDAGKQHHKPHVPSGMKVWLFPLLTESPRGLPLLKGAALSKVSPFPKVACIQWLVHGNIKLWFLLWRVAVSASELPLASVCWGRHKDSTAQLFPLPTPASFSSFTRVLTSRAPPPNFLCINLHLRVCFLESPACNSSDLEDA